MGGGRGTSLLVWHDITLPLVLQPSKVRRPKLEVSMDEVRQLRILGFSWTNIAELLNIGRPTLYRRVEGSGIMGYTDMIGV